MNDSGVTKVKFELLPLCEEDIKQFKTDMQAAFQQGAADEFGEMEEEILPETHIDRFLSAKGSAAYKAVVDGEMVGGAVVGINEETGHNHLDFLYVKAGVHGKGIGYQIWTAIEQKHPNTAVWETCTPYFEKRNIHFYINRCGFHAVEFFNRYHTDPHHPEDYEDFPENYYFEGMFRFEKVMKLLICSQIKNAESFEKQNFRRILWCP